MNWDSGFYCLITEHHVLENDSQFFFFSTLLTENQQSNPTCELPEYLSAYFGLMRCISLKENTYFYGACGAENK